MNKFLVLAALLGMAVANENDFWTEGVPTTKGWLYQRTLVDESYFSFKIMTECDFGFGTFYKSIFNDANAAYTLRGHQYGVHLYSYCRQSAHTTIGDFYDHVGEVQIEPLYVNPYTQSVSYFEPRPEDTYKFDINLAGLRYIDFLDYNTYWSENMKVVEQSLYDVAFKDGETFLPESSDFAYNDEYMEDYHDKKLSGNILKHINADSYNELK